MRVWRTECVTCGDIFTLPHHGGSPPKYCPGDCRREAEAAKHRRRYDRDPEYVKEKSQRYKAENREHVRERARQYMARRRAGRVPKPRGNLYSETEDAILSSNISNIEASRLVGRTLDSVKSRRKKLRKMAKS